MAERYNVLPWDRYHVSTSPSDSGKWVLYDDHVAEVARLQARERELEASLTNTAAHLAAAISLLERGGKAGKKAASSDKMFDIMLDDYRTSLERARAALAAVSAEAEDDDE
jgi:hypothetical protein